MTSYSRRTEKSDDVGSQEKAGAGRSREQWVERAHEYAMNSIGHSDRTTQQIREGMAHRKIPDDVVEEVVTHLTSVGLLNDEAFAVRYVETRHRLAGLAPSRIAMELRRKGVAADVVDAAIEQSGLGSDSQERRAAELAERIAPKHARHPVEVAVRRTAASLARKGYSSGVAFAAARAAVANRDSDQDLFDVDPADMETLETEEGTS